MLWRSQHRHRPNDEGPNDDGPNDDGPNNDGKEETMMADALIADRIRADLSTNDVVLYLKGTPVFPQCGFSAQAVQILGMLGVKFKGVDVLTDPKLRQGIKDFSNWPTVPQLYVKGEFVGGCDIMREMFQTGELEKILIDKGIGVETRQHVS
jgi:monothiol glutaredoxin